MLNANEKSTGKGSKGNGSKAQAQEEAEQTKGSATPGSVDTKALWASVKACEAKNAQLQMQMDEVAVEKSGLLKQLATSLGTGPFQIAGLGLVTIRSRKSKVEGKPDTYFFVGQGQRSITVIE